MLNPLTISRRLIDSIGAKQPFIYVQNISIAAALGTNQQNLQIDQATHFLWTQIGITDSLDTNSMYQPNNCKVLIQLQSNANFLSSTYVEQAIYSPRNGQGWFMEPVLIPRGYNILTAAQDISNSGSGTANTTVNVYFIGFKLDPQRVNLAEFGVS